MERRGHPRIPINNVDDYSCIVSDMLDAFMTDIYDNHKDDGYIRPLDENDSGELHEHCSFAYTSKGTEIYERYIRRVKKVGAKYFDEDEIEVSTLMYQEY